MTRHRADLLSLTAGLLFCAMGLVLLSGGLHALALEWVGPLLAIVSGVALILAARSVLADQADVPPGD